MDVDRLFTNMEILCEVSATLLHRMYEAMADPDLEAVVIGNATMTLAGFHYVLTFTAVVYVEQRI